MLDHKCGKILFSLSHLLMTSNIHQSLILFVPIFGIMPVLATTMQRRMEGLSSSNAFSLSGRIVSIRRLNTRIYLIPLQMIFQLYLLVIVLTTLPDRKDWLTPFWCEAFRKTSESSQPTFLGINLHRMHCQPLQESGDAVAAKSLEPSTAQAL